MIWRINYFTSNMDCCMIRAMLLLNKLLEQLYVKEYLKSSRRKFCCQYRDLSKNVFNGNIMQIINKDSNVRKLLPVYYEWVLFTCTRITLELK